MSNNNHNTHEALGGLVDISINASEALVSLVAVSSEIDSLSERSQAMAAASEELVASIKEIALNGQAISKDVTEAGNETAQAAQAADHAMEAMAQVATEVEGTAAQIASLDQKSLQIGGMVKQIEAIAKQTNLLALNATIEAARAGDAGRGFAIVAREVKELAVQAATATEDIRGNLERLREETARVVALINSSAKAAREGRERVNRTHELVNGISERMHEVSGRMGQVTGILSQQHQSSDEIARGIVEVSTLAHRNREDIGRVLQAMERSDKVIEAELSRLAHLTDNLAVALRAKSDHISFKKRISSALIDRIDLRSDQVPDHHTCRFGKWYDNVIDPALLNTPSFRAIEQVHREVHEHAKRALQHKEGHRAELITSEVAALDQSSQKVVGLLQDLCADIQRQLASAHVTAEIHASN